jgi:alpha-ribazole phosphatase/probable phosphoglycerate mutase
MEMTRSSGDCRVILVRHAHTAMAGRFCGHSDPPLDEIGRQQLGELTDKLETYPINRIYSSDLLRARQTAEPIARMLNLDVHVLPSLREIGFGRWEGMDWAAVAEKDAVYAQQWVDSFPTLPAPEGEELEDFRRRIRDAMDLVADQTVDGCAVVVTHGGVIRTFLRDVLRLSASEYRQLNCDYTSCWELRRNGVSWSGSGSEKSI